MDERITELIEVAALTRGNLQSLRDVILKDGQLSEEIKTYLIRFLPINQLDYCIRQAREAQEDQG